MKLRKKKTPIYKRKSIWIIVILIVVAVSGGVYLYHRHQIDVQNKQNQAPLNPNQPNIDYGPPKQSDNIGETDKFNDKSSDQKTSTPMKVTISSASQQDQTVYIRALIDGANTGTCTLTATLDGTSFTRSAPINAQASYAICQGFNIQVSDFPTAGKWSFKIVATNNTDSAEATTTIEVTK